MTTQDQSKTTQGSQGEASGAAGGGAADADGGDTSASDKAAFLSSLAEGKKTSAAKADGQTASTGGTGAESAAEAQAGTTDEDTDKDSAADSATAEDKDEGGKKPEPEPEPELDKATQKRIAAVQRAEKASKQALAAERQKMAAERAEWEEQTRETRQKIGAFEKMLGALRTNPIGVLQALGVTEDRFEDMSKLLYAHSPRGKADPRARELAESGLKDREYRDELTTLRTEIKELKQSREKEQAEAAAERELNTRMGKITKTAKASTEAPLFAKFYAKSPEKAESQLLTITYELARKTGEFPDPEDVIAAFEKKRREDLEDLGIDVSAMLTSKTPIQPKQKDKAAAEQRPAQTLSNDQGTSSQVQPELTEEEERAKIVADLRKLRAQATA